MSCVCLMGPMLLSFSHFNIFSFVHKLSNVIHIMLDLVFNKAKTQAIKGWYVPYFFMVLYFFMEKNTQNTRERAASKFPNTYMTSNDVKWCRDVTLWARVLYLAIQIRMSEWDCPKITFSNLVNLTYDLDHHTEILSRYLPVPNFVPVCETIQLLFILYPRARIDGWKHKWVQSRYLVHWQGGVI